MTAVKDSNPNMIIVNIPELYHTDGTVVIPDDQINAMLVARESTVSWLGEISFKTKNVDYARVYAMDGTLITVIFQSCSKV